MDDTRNKLFFFLFIFCFVAVPALANGLPVCIDMTSPSAPRGLSVADSVLQWKEVVDLPDCSGIKYYVVYKNNSLLGTTNLTSYPVNITPGTNVFKVLAVDLAKHRGPSAEITVTKSADSGDSNPGSPSGGGGGGGGVAGGFAIGSGATGGGETQTSGTEPTIVNINIEGIPVNKVEIYSESGESVTVNIQESEGSGVENAYKYLQINVSSPVTEAWIYFDVELSWITEQGLTTDDIVMLKQVNGEWIELETVFLGEDEILAQFKAMTPGFSNFAIGVRKSAAIKETEPIVEEPAVQETIPLQIPFIAVGGFLVFVAIAVIYRKR